MTTPINVKAPVVVSLPAKKGTAEFNPKVRHSAAKTKDQPLVKVRFIKEVACGGKLYEPDVDYDIPLDLAHSLAASIKK